MKQLKVIALLPDGIHAALKTEAKALSRTLNGHVKELLIERYSPQLESTPKRGLTIRKGGRI